MSIIKKIILLVLVLFAILGAAWAFGFLSDGESADTDSIAADIRELWGHTEEMDDAELGARIRAIAHRHDFPLVDSQVDQLVSLCRGAEKLSPEQLDEKAEELRDSLESLRRTGEELSKLQRMFRSIGDASKDIIGKAKDLFNNIKANIKQ